jgi:hypothetical protein
MSDMYWLSATQVERLKPYFPQSNGVPRVDHRRQVFGWRLFG